MASFPFKPLQQQTQLHLSSLSLSNHSALTNFKFYLSSYSPTVSHTKHTFELQFKVHASASSKTRRLSGDIAEERSGKNVSTSPNPDFVSDFSSFTDASKRADRKALERNRIGAVEPIEKRVILKDRHAKIGIKRNEDGRRVSSTRFKGKNSRVLSEHEDSRLIKWGNNGVPVKETKKKSRKAKIDTPGHTLRVGLDMCSKRGDVVGAIKLYDLAKKESVKLGQYHYAVVLYLCSSAATGVVQPAKSGSGSRSLSSGDPFMENSAAGSESLSALGEIAKSSDSVGEFNTDATDFGDGEVGKIRNFINGSTENTYHQSLDGFVQSLRNNADYRNSKDDGSNSDGIQVSEEVKRTALQRGFEIYNEMRLQEVTMNEAIFTSVARMAMAFGDGDMAFDMVRQMKEYGINPRLRSYGPALAIFCSNADVENAFKVEKHMLENGVYPEEPELEALLKVSIEAGKGDKVYYVLHKLRTGVRQVSPTTAELIERWFRSKTASRVGKRKFDRESISQAMQNGGGGWHGKGWLGKGKWTVRRSPVSSDGLCKCCGKKLVTIDLDPEETENFAKSVASIAVQREKNSSFQKFQKWLDYYGPFEAVVDAANVGLYSQRRFKPSKVNAVVNGIRQMLPSRKWPLIILHNRRITGDKMDEPFNKSLIDKWKTADALYATPTGSNDDWYWLYAAIKCRCLLVTNDEMRDHLFQLFGNDFFPKWKERHQVHFNFTETGPAFRMPPPCSVVIQETEEGEWHIPIASELENEEERIWLCCSRTNSSLASIDSSDLQKESHISNQKKRETRTGVETQHDVETVVGEQGRHVHSKEELQELSTDITTVSNNHAYSLLPQLKAAEKLGDCLIDFQI